MWIDDVTMQEVSPAPTLEPSTVEPSAE
jgi:hypothetical protein